MVSGDFSFFNPGIVIGIKNFTSTNPLGIQTITMTGIEQLKLQSGLNIIVLELIDPWTTAPVKAVKGVTGVTGVAAVEAVEAVDEIVAVAAVAASEGVEAVKEVIGVAAVAAVAARAAIEAVAAVTAVDEVIGVPKTVTMDVAGGVYLIDKSKLQEVVQPVITDTTGVIVDNRFSELHLNNNGGLRGHG